MPNAEGVSWSDVLISDILLHILSFCTFTDLLSHQYISTQWRRCCNFDSFGWDDDDADEARGDVYLYQILFGEVLQNSGKF
jgi:hypothetical protein